MKLFRTLLTVITILSAITSALGRGRDIEFEKAEGSQPVAVAAVAVADTIYKPDVIYSPSPNNMRLQASG